MSVLSLIVILLGAALVAAAQWKGAHPGVLSLIAAATGYVAAVIEHRAMRSFKRSMAAPPTSPPVRNPNVPPPPEHWDSAEGWETYREAMRDVGRLERELEAARTQAEVDVSNLSEGYAYRIYRKWRRGEGRPGVGDAPCEEHGTTTDPLLAATLVEQGWKAELFPVWVLADGRVARKRGGSNYFTIIKEIQA